jgi:hypothetical protein
MVSMSVSISSFSSYEISTSYFLYTLDCGSVRLVQFTTLGHVFKNVSYSQTWSLKQRCCANLRKVLNGKCHKLYTVVGVTVIFCSNRNLCSCLDKNNVTLRHLRHCTEADNQDNSEINISPLVRDIWVTESFAVRRRRTVCYAQFVQ